MADGGGNDRLSALPDDALRLPSVAEAARTSVLSRRWRYLWTTLPELRFPSVTDLARVSTVLRHHAVPALHKLSVLHELPSASRSGVCRNAPDKIADVLAVAVERLEGVIVFNIATPENRNSEAGIGDVVAMSCFHKATDITISLGYLSIRLPPFGRFEKLTALRLNNVRFDSQCDLSDVVSSKRCPSLQELRVYRARGLSNLAIRSESLLLVDLSHLGGLGLGLRQLTIFAPVLGLGVFHCFTVMAPIAVFADMLRHLRHFGGLICSVGAQPNLVRCHTSRN